VGLLRIRPVRTTGRFSRRPTWSSYGGCFFEARASQAAVDLIDVELLRVEVAAGPFEQFCVTLVLGICDGIQELAITPRPADVLGRAASGALDETRKGDARDDRCDGFQHHDAAAEARASV
jgi:hypothetical protein